MNVITIKYIEKGIRKEHSFTERTFASYLVNMEREGRFKYMGIDFESGKIKYDVIVKGENEQEQEVNRKNFKICVEFFKEVVIAICDALRYLSPQSCG